MAPKKRHNDAKAVERRGASASQAGKPAGIPKGLKRALCYVGSVFLMLCAVYTGITMVIQGGGVAIGIVGVIVFAAVAVRLFRMGCGEEFERIPRPGERRR